MVTASPAAREIRRRLSACEVWTELYWRFVTLLRSKAKMSNNRERKKVIPFSKSAGHLSFRGTSDENVGLPLNMGWLTPRWGRLYSSDNCLSRTNRLVRAWPRSCRQTIKTGYGNEWIGLELPSSELEFNCLRDLGSELVFNGIGIELQRQNWPRLWYRHLQIPELSPAYKRYVFPRLFSQKPKLLPGRWSLPPIGEVWESWPIIYQGIIAK